MRRTTAALATTAVLAALLAGCTGGSTGTGDATASTSSTPEVANEESAPESPIAYGLVVPQGAIQLGPLVRQRSAGLVAAYAPQLQAAQAVELANERQEAEQAQEEGATPPTETTPPPTRPSDDTFKPIGDPPSADTTTSVMRIDDSPSDVVHRMLKQVGAVLPDAGVDPDALDRYCSVTDGRYTGCAFSTTGLTPGDREIRVSFRVWPGDVATRTSLPSAQENPVMVLTVQYVGDPREGQRGKDTDGIEDVPSDGSEAPESDVIWPKMDVDAPADTPLLDGSWTVPEGSTILLASNQPRIVMLRVDTAKDADAIARRWAHEKGAGGRFTVDTLQDLNEIDTAYTSVRRDGAKASATFVLTGRGNYVYLTWTPAAKAS